jgi:hypothetical protein
MLAEGKEAYTEFALKHYDWERIEKTKGQIIENQVDYISDAICRFPQNAYYEFPKNPS